jgi:hypothetical protein
MIGSIFLLFYDMKSLEQRLKECFAIKKQLEAVGVLVLPENNSIVSTHMNRFIKEATSETFYIEAGAHKLQIILTINEHKKSGVTVMSPTP